MNLSVSCFHLVEFQPPNIVFNEVFSEVDKMFNSYIKLTRTLYTTEFSEKVTSFVQVQQYISLANALVNANQT